MLSQLMLGIVTASASLNLYYMNPLDLLPEKERKLTLERTSSVHSTIESPAAPNSPHNKSLPR
jgi:hypothetical protein